jgi:hypothetical protein
LKILIIGDKILYTKHLLTLKTLKLYMVRRSVVVFILLIFSILTISALYQDCEIYGTCDTAADLISRINYSTKDVNNSQYLRGLTPQEVADLYVETDPIFNSWLDVPLLENPLNLQEDTVNQIIPMLNISNSNTNGTAFTTYSNNLGHGLDIGTYGYELSQLLFPTLLNENESAVGIVANSPLWFTTRSNHTISFGSSPTDYIGDMDFTVKIDPQSRAIIYKDNIFTKSLDLSVGASYATINNNSFSEGAVSFSQFTRDASGTLYLQKAEQVGKNNSGSILPLNSLIHAPKDWLEATVEVESEILNGGGLEVDNFFGNKTNCLLYQEYLESLGLSPYGLSQVCDTTGRLVPQAILGDVDIIRGLQVQESITSFDAFDFIGNEGNDFNILFNGGLENGALHIIDRRQILANITNFSRTICNFNDGTLCDLVSESIAPEPGRDWDSVLETQCHEDRCAKSQGGNEKIMSISEGTQGATNINISFWITSILSGGDSFTITLDDNLGNTTTIFTELGITDDVFNSFIMPSTFENKSNVTTRFILNGQNNNRQVWIDDIKVTAIFNPSQEINDSFDGGKILLGEDRGSLSCLIEAGKQINNNTLDTEWVLNLGSPGCITKFIGNVTIDNPTIENSTTIGNALITGDLTVEGNTTSSYYFGDGSQLTGITSNWNVSGTNLFPKSLNYDVGIGTNTPTESLQIVGGNIGLDNNQGITSLDVAGTKKTFIYHMNNDDNIVFGFSNEGAVVKDYEFYNSGNDLRMIIKENGNVGIKNTNPTTDLNVGGQANTLNTMSLGGSPSVNGVSRFFLSSSNTQKSWGIAYNNYVAGGLEFSQSTTNGGTALSSPLMVIDNVGKVGIGTTTPQNSLDISGGQVIGSTYAGRNTAPTDGLLVEGKVGIGTTSGDGKLTIAHTGAEGQTALVLQRTDSSQSNGGIRWQDSTGNNEAGILTRFNSADTGNLEFMNGATTNMILTSAGNVGIGTTDPSTILEVENSESIITIDSHGSSGAGRFQFQNEGVSKLFTGVTINDNWGGLPTGTSANDSFTRFDGEKYFFTYSNNLNILTLENSGNVGINTTTPQNTLNVVGDLNVTGDYINGANTGLTGNYSVGSCWNAYSGGIMYATNCTTL